jgi:hypothetical protein
MRIIASRTYSLSVACLVAAAGLCMVAIARAVTVEPVEAAEPAAPGVASTAELSRGGDPVARVPSEGVLGTDALAQAIDRDPFRPDRMRAQPYRLPDERVSRRVEVREEEPVEPPPFRIIGTASAGSRSMALVQPLESGEIDMVLIGRDFQGYRLASVDNESATLVMRDRTFRLGIQEGMAAGADTRMAGIPVEAWQSMLRTLRDRGLSEEVIGRIMDANLNAARSGNAQWTPLSQLGQFGELGRRGLFFGQVESNAGWTAAPPAAPEPRRLPPGRAGRGGRMSADTLSHEPR